MAGSSTSVSQNQSQSQSTTNVLDYPERAFLDSIAQYAGQVGSNVYNWAQGEYAKNSNLTDANIHNYLTTSAQSLGMANNDLNRYENKFQPEEDQLLRDANEYASPQRKLMAMGAAESGQAQASEAARKNAERDLQSYGVDPSSGRYAALDRAAQVSAGAAEAGAAQQAAQHTEDVGRDLRSQAIAVGAQYPGRISNSMNTALQGFAGAENAGLANANTGVALQGAANPFLNTASSYKPITGTNSTSSSSGASASNSVTTDPPQQSKDPAQPKQQTDSGGGGYPGSTSAGTGSGSTSSGSQSSNAPGSDGTSSGGYGDYSGGSGGLPDGGYNGGGYGGDPYTGGPDDSGYNGGGYGGDPYAGSGDNYASGGYNPDMSGYNGGGYGGDPYAGGGDSYGDAGQAAYDSGGGGGDLGGAYAQGGAIPDGDGDETGGIPQDGGAIPQSASPSGGQMVDDVRAQGPQGAINVNADEFVIPRDVALWKGQEFFQKLIAQSRQARVTAPAHPTRGAPAPAQNMR